MRASNDPQGMTDDQLESAGQHHRSMAQAYRKLAEGEQSRQLAAARLKMADTHADAADRIAAEIKRRGA